MTNKELEEKYIRRALYLPIRVSSIVAGEKGLCILYLNRIGLMETSDFIGRYYK